MSSVLQGSVQEISAEHSTVFPDRKKRVTALISISFLRRADSADNRDADSLAFACRIDDPDFLPCRL